MSHLMGNNLKQRKIAIPAANGFDFLTVSNTIYCKAESDHTWVYLHQSDKVLTTKALKYFEALLPEDSFFRCHKSFLVHLNFVKKYKKRDGDHLELDNGTWIELSGRKKEALLHRICKFRCCCIKKKSRS